MCVCVCGLWLGLLFLSGGNASLKRDNQSVAFLLLSVLPRFPARTVDQQFLLQPLRHLYALAVETRGLHCVDADTGEPVAIDIEVGAWHACWVK